VEKDSIPPKKEYLIYAPLTETQREIYDAIVDGGLRSYLMGGKKGSSRRRSRSTMVQ
jgi:ATP-dependent DNA helicase